MTREPDDLKRHIGDSATAEDGVTASQIGRLAAALDVAHPAQAKGDGATPWATDYEGDLAVTAEARFQA